MSLEANSLMKTICDNLQKEYEKFKENVLLASPTAEVVSKQAFISACGTHLLSKKQAGTGPIARMEVILIAFGMSAAIAREKDIDKLEETFELERDKDSEQ